MKNLFAICFFIYLNFCSFSAKTGSAAGSDRNYGVLENIMSLFDDVDVMQAIQAQNVTITASEPTVIRKPRVNTRNRTSAYKPSELVEEVEAVVQDKSDYDSIKDHILNEDFLDDSEDIEDVIDDNESFNDSIDDELEEKEPAKNMRFMSSSSRFDGFTRVIFVLLISLFFL
jgi:hypothetical protein